MIREFLSDFIKVSFQLTTASALGRFQLSGPYSAQIDAFGEQALPPSLLWRL